MHSLTSTSKRIAALLFTTVLLMVIPALIVCDHFFNGGAGLTAISHLNHAFTFQP